jgi:hypothetical protein
MISDHLMSNSSKSSQVLKQLLTSGRHQLISTMILIQNLKSAPLTVRLQMSVISLGATPNRDKLIEWLNSFRGSYSRD